MHTTKLESHCFLLQTRREMRWQWQSSSFFYSLFTCNSSLDTVIAVMVPLLQFMDVVIIHFLSLPASCSLFFFKRKIFPHFTYSLNVLHRHIYMHACILCFINKWKHQFFSPDLFFIPKKNQFSPIVLPTTTPIYFLSSKK